MTGHVAVAGGKGGCGKTTTSLGLALAAARLGERPLVVDTDHQLPDLHLLAGIAETPGLGAVADGADPDQVGQPVPDAPSVSVLPAGRVETAAVRSALARLGHHRLTVLDCPAGAGRDVTAPLRAADRSVLVTTATRQSLQDTVKTAAMARALDAGPVGAVVVGQPCEDRTQPVDEADCERLFDCPLLAVVPRVERSPLEAGRVRSTHNRLAKKVLERNI